ncbi:MAG TPA: 16S rRNA (uracil(1498)-N(3))-methyltransferase [Candidatus Gallacutalibacter stercoravium]|nr:16S rRNA (uracil(1498)-N(3))-methyltransferase [Candidatus Gallacutalibacter stercoravium]
MPRFFVPPISGDSYIVTGGDAQHIAKSLRMRPGEQLTLCDGATDYRCVVSSVSPQAVELQVEGREPCRSEPSLRVTLYQALPKGDRMDYVVQKAVELGVYEIAPILTERCVSRPDRQGAQKKIARWQKIAAEAAKQSGRGLVPQITPLLDFSQALERAGQAQCRLLFYEGGGGTLNELMPAGTQTAAVFIGPEGGFALQEVQQALDSGLSPATLGPRILRTDTAPLAALTALMLLSGNLQ